MSYPNASNGGLNSASADFNPNGSNNGPPKFFNSKKTPNPDEAGSKIERNKSDAPQPEG